MISKTNEHFEYLRYLDQIYKEVIQFFSETGELADPEKVRFFVGMTARPCFYWEQEQNREQEKSKQTAPMSEEAKENLLVALVRKYRLQSAGGLYAITQKIDVPEFKRLAEKMNELGYRYDREKRAFVGGI